MLTLLLLLALTSPSPARADDAPTYQIQAVDPSIPVEKMAQPGVQVHAANEPVKGGYDLPLPAMRDRAFSRVGLKAEIASWDQLDRDLLFVRARDQSLTQLTKKYPRLPRNKLKALSGLLKASDPKAAGTP